MQGGKEVQEKLNLGVEFRSLYELLVMVRQKLQTNSKVFFENLSPDFLLQLNLITRGGGLVTKYSVETTYDVDHLSVLKQIQKEVLLCEGLLSDIIHEAGFSPEMMRTPQFKVDFSELYSFEKTNTTMKVLLPVILDKFESFKRVGGFLPLSEKQLSKFCGSIFDDLTACEEKFKQLFTSDFVGFDGSKEENLFDLSKETLDVLVHCCNRLKDCQFLLNDSRVNGIKLSQEFLLEIQELQEDLPWVFCDYKDFLTNPPMFYSNNEKGINLLSEFIEICRVLEKNRSDLQWEAGSLLQQYGFMPDSDSESDELEDETRNAVVGSLQEIYNVGVDLIEKVQKDSSYLLTADKNPEFFEIHYKLKGQCFFWVMMSRSPEIRNDSEILKALERVIKLREDLFRLIGPEKLQETSGVVREVVILLGNF